LKHLFRRGAAVAAACAVAGVAALAAALAPGSPASAASVNQWRLANVWAHTQGQFYAVSSSGPNDAWAVGVTGPANNPTGTMAAHWGGKAWQTVTVPGSKGLILDEVGESAANNVWVIGDSTQSGVTSTAFVFDGVHWHTNKLPIYGVHQLLVFAPNDVWIGDNNECSSYTCTNSIYHWNGKYWQYRPLTEFLYAMTGTSGGNLWAIGFTGYASGYLTAYHWLGGTWTPTTLPHVQGGFYLGAATTSSTDNWISSVTTNGKSTFVVHGTATGWKTITAPSTVDATPAPVPDGHGGVWLGSQAYWTGGKWLPEWLPGYFTEGWTGISAAFIKARGTTGSYWSAGFTQPGSTASMHPAISVWGPLP